jgi:hypothetical protein
MPAKSTQAEAKDTPKYKYLRSGKTFTLNIVAKEIGQFGRTHQATGEDGSFWDGTEAEFRAQFDKL